MAGGTGRQRTGHPADIQMKGTEMKRRIIALVIAVLILGACFVRADMQSNNEQIKIASEEDIEKIYPYIVAAFKSKS